MTIRCCHDIRTDLCGICNNERASGSLKRVVGPTAREIYKETTRNRRYVKKLRRIGASNYEIANALGIKETDPVLQE